MGDTETKNWLIFLHPGRSCYDTINIFSQTVGDHLRAAGYGVSFVEAGPADPDYAPQLLEQLEKGVDAALAINAVGQQETTTNGENVWDALGIPFFNWIIDHPVIHHDNLVSRFDRYHVICVDRNHAQYVRRFYPHVPHVHFLPVAGITADDGGSTGGEGNHDFASRPFEISFTGGYFPLSALDESLGQLSERRRNHALSLKEILLNDPACSIEDACAKVFETQHITPSDDMILACTPELRYANACVRMALRERRIRSLAVAGLPLHLFGENWELMEGLEGTNVTLHGSVDYMESARVAAQTKVMLGDCALFYGGLHDRVATALLNGAAVLTDAGSYMRESFVTEGDTKELFTFEPSGPDSVPEAAASLLKDMEGCASMASRGQKKAGSLCTWEKTTERLLGFL